MYCVMALCLCALLALWPAGIILERAADSERKTKENREEKAKGKDRLLQLFSPAGRLLYLAAQKAGRKKERAWQRKIKARLSCLYVKENVEAEYRQFQVQRFTYLWLLAAAGLALGLAAGGAEGFAFRQKISELQRPAPGEGTVRYELEADSAQNGSLPVELSVAAQPYTEQEIQTLFQQTYETALELLPGENPSLDQVSKPLYFWQPARPAGLQAGWKPEQWSYLSGSGAITAENIPEEGIVTSVILTLTCQGQTIEYQIPCRLVPPALSAQEALQQQVSSLIEAQEKDDPYSSSVTLPGLYQEQPLTFYTKKEWPAGLILSAAGLLTAILFFINQGQKLQEEERRRGRQMLLDYPEILTKLTVLTGAGLSVRGSWERIVGDYSSRRGESGQDRRYAYEEMLYAYRGMQGGEPELSAYKRFGKRCGLQQYRKLALLLEQGLKRGGRDLNERLKTEMEEAFSSRIHQARRQGEQTGTKLMIPMFLMFILVLFMLLVPALMSFSQI